MQFFSANTRPEVQHLLCDAHVQVCFKYYLFIIYVAGQGSG